jgi:hypothetical protein
MQEAELCGEITILAKQLKVCTVPNDLRHSETVNNRAPPRRLACPVCKHTLMATCTLRPVCDSRFVKPCGDPRRSSGPLSGLHPGSTHARVTQPHVLLFRSTVSSMPQMVHLPHGARPRQCREMCRQTCCSKWNCRSANPLLWSCPCAANFARAALAATGLPESEATPRHHQ